MTDFADHAIVIGRSLTAAPAPSHRGRPNSEERMEISLPRKWKRFVRKQVRSGKYASESEVISAALLLLLIPNHRIKFWT